MPMLHDCGDRARAGVASRRSTPSWMDRYFAAFVESSMLPALARRRTRRGGLDAKALGIRPSRPGTASSAS
jgi:hypothetical protein